MKDPNEIAKVEVNEAHITVLVHIPGEEWAREVALTPEQKRMVWSIAIEKGRVKVKDHIVGAQIRKREPEVDCS